MRAELLEASDPRWKRALDQLAHDVYQLPDYLLLEAARTGAQARAFLLEDAERIFLLPYLVRDCGDVSREPQDASSWDADAPYGYPGYLLSEAGRADPEFLTAAIEALTQRWRDAGCCSAFLRLHPILSVDPSRLAGPRIEVTHSETVSIDLSLSEEEMQAAMNRKLRSAIRKCQRLGFTCRCVSYLEQLPVFQEIYEDTMTRVSARELYFFDRPYFEGLGKLKAGVHLHLVEWKNEVLAACLVFECGGIVQAHLGGTRSEYLNMSPFNLLLYEIGLWAKSRGNRLFHLGGGVGGHNDKLFLFKAQYSRVRHQFHTLRIVIDPERYERWVVQRASAVNAPVDRLLESGYFPAYRWSAE